MSNELNALLIRAYNLYKDESNPPVPLESIKEYLKFEGLDIDDLNNIQKIQGDQVG